MPCQRVLRETVYEEDGWSLAVVAEMDRDIFELNALMFPVVEVRQLAQHKLREDEGTCVEKTEELHGEVNDTESQRERLRIAHRAFIYLRCPAMLGRSISLVLGRRHDSRHHTGEIYAWPPLVRLACRILSPSFLSRCLHIPLAYKNVSGAPQTAGHVPLCQLTHLASNEADVRCLGIGP
jgi:hypothetical protein